MDNARTFLTEMIEVLGNRTVFKEQCILSYIDATRMRNKVQLIWDSTSSKSEHSVLNKCLCCFSSPVQFVIILHTNKRQTHLDFVQTTSACVSHQHSPILNLSLASVWFILMSSTQLRMSSTGPQSSAPALT